MSTSTQLFDYFLPSEHIAQQSVEPRDHSRLLVLDRLTGEMHHHHFFEIEKELRAGDLLVLNDTKVFKARLHGWIGQRKVEVFLLRPQEENFWHVLLKPGRKVHVGDQIDFDGLSGRILTKKQDGTAQIKINGSVSDVFHFADLHGEVPIPPYVGHMPDSSEAYQTTYARSVGSVAAPTAGFHFTERLIADLKKKGIAFAFVTLHVGLGTFRPIKTETIEQHEMHAEFVEISSETAQYVNEAKQHGRRVIAVGTTTVRALEGAALASFSSFEKDGKKRYLPEQGFIQDVNLFIAPGFTFRILDGLITNFHLPKSTLLMLVAAFIDDRAYALQCYQEAIDKKYRFYSFGDAMFIC
ncbi:TPA: tRNA preQ1(34) S-adenosylmethionine ribosyltransferase-isomerase QueA [Candidatus Uhrbacteria bacterium]|nr:tRNA preQ1(34) S-adenosylmethionine ribosyltransferase-isomerase QueA [Candidatus Uhrbacteria bacterium]